MRFVSGAAIAWSLSAPLMAHIAPDGRAGVAPGSSLPGAALVLGCLLLAAFGYARGLARLAREKRQDLSGQGLHGQGVHRQGLRRMGLRTASFMAGLCAVALALLSPLDRWSAQSFALHMVQHEVLLLIAAPLLVIGRPLPLWLWAFSARARQALGGLSRQPAVRRAWALLLFPPAAWLLHAGVLALWHLPVMFDAALRNAVLHDVQHLTFLIAALVFWASLHETRRLDQQGAAVMYLFTTTIYTGAWGALMTFATRPWYSAYLQTPGSWGLTALEDQQLGGLIMWIPGSLVFVGWGLACLARWIVASDLRASGSPHR